MLVSFRSISDISDNRVHGIYEIMKCIRIHVESVFILNGFEKGIICIDGCHKFG